MRSVAEAYGSSPADGTERRIGAFLVKTAYQVTVITSAVFLTAMAANLLIARLAGDVGVELTWTGWALAAVVPGVTSLILIPLLIYKLYPPEIKATPQASEMAADRLREMGPVKASEKLTLVAFFGLLALWSFGKTLGVHSTVAALLGLTFLLVAGVLTWRDVLDEHGAWDTLVWFAALVLGFFSNLFASLTHYASGPAPVLFGAGYVSMGAWWSLGGGINIVNVALWTGIGLVWWRLIGLL